MSNRQRRRSRGASVRKAARRAPREPLGEAGQLSATVRSPGDALAMIPYLLGFDPHHSVVVVAIDGPRRRFGHIMRADLVEPDGAPGLVAYLVSVVEAHAADCVLVAAYAERRDAADAVVPGLVAGLEAIGVSVLEGLLTDGRRWWSYTCDSPRCCPPDGTPFDPTTSALAAHAVAAGMSKAPDRDTLRQQFEPLPDAVREEVGEIVDRMLTDAYWIDEPDNAPSPAEEMAALVVSALDGDLDTIDVAWLLSLAQDIEARDAAWWQMTRENARLHFELWRQVMRAAPDDLLAPAGSLCAFAAWLAGAGALASHAVERVAEVAPDYPMMTLVADALVSNLNPDVWEARPQLLGPART